jgi:hypothetical protein
VKGDLRVDDIRLVAREDGQDQFHVACLSFLRNTLASLL